MTAKRHILLSFTMVRIMYIMLNCVVSFEIPPFSYIQFLLVQSHHTAAQQYDDPPQSLI